MSAPFNAATDPWLPTVATGGTTTLRSLIDVFDHADELCWASDLPRNEAMHRLSLAVTYAALGTPTPDAYLSRHTTGATLPAGDVATWLRSNTRHFEVTGSAPFLQDATLADADLTRQNAAILDETVARARPLLSDHRTFDDCPPPPVTKALLDLLTTHAYAAGGRFTGWSAFFTGGALTGQSTYRAGGTIGDALAWAHLPTPAPLDPSWTYQDLPTASLSAPRANLWLSRRALLDLTDDGHVSAATLQPGWRRAETKVNLDTETGKEATVIAADPTRPLVGDPTRPLETLVAAWHRSSEGSLAWWMREAHAHGATLPDVLVTGQSMNQSAWRAMSAHVLPAATLTAADDLDATLEAIVTERKRQRARGRSLPVGATYLALTDPANTDTALNRNVTRERVERPRPPGLWSTRRAAVEGTGTDPFAVSVNTPDATTATDTAAALRSIFHELRNNPDRARQVRDLALAGLPAPEAIPECGDDTALRVVVSLLATWLCERPRANTDGSASLVTLARGSGSSDSFRQIDAATRRPLAGTYGLLRAVLSRLPGPYAPDWMSLYQDLSEWGDYDVRRQWRDELYPTK